MNLSSPGQLTGFFLTQVATSCAASQLTPWVYPTPASLTFLASELSNTFRLAGFPYREQGTSLSKTNPGREDDLLAVLVLPSRHSVVSKTSIKKAISSGRTFFFEHPLHCPQLYASSLSRSFGFPSMWNCPTS